jgi:carbonic anhydrase
MHSRPWLALTLTAAVLASGCKQWKAPEKVAELEKRVDELSEVVSEMKGRPVGKKKLPPKPKKEDGEEEETEGEGEEGADSGPEAKPAEGEEGGGGEEKAAPTKDAKKAGFGKKDVAEKDAPARDKDDKADAKDAKADAKDAKDAKKDDKAEAKADEAAKKEAPAKEGKGATAAEPILAAAHKKLGPPAHWSYEGESGPEHWGELEDDFSTCANGQLQSPIDVLPPGGKRASDIVFVYQPTKARVVDTGHTLQVVFDPGNTIFIDGHRYDLVQMHVHTPSEHTIAGERYPAELHLVHRDSEGKLAVIAVLYDEGQASSIMDSVYRRWPSKPNDEKALGKLDVAALLPDNRGVFRYEGSLTTPPCSEGVVWNVMRRTRTDSAAHLALFKKHYPANARPVQKLNGRDVR